MDLRKILADLRSERDRINQAIAAIEAISLDGAKPTLKPARATAPRRRRRLSAAARKRLSALLKARWASGKMRKAKAKGTAAKRRG